MFASLLGAITGIAKADTDTTAQSEEKQQNKLDLVFVVDCTASMGSYIESAQKNIVQIIEAVQASEKVDVRFGLISYRDHPPQDNSYITKKFDFTNSVPTAQKYVNSMRAQGGGDTPEAVCCGLYDALNLKYRDGAVKIVVFVSDAPPHGLSDNLGDMIPNGCPTGRDPMKIAREMLEKEIIVYCVGCEPALSSYAFVKQWFCALAQVTGGRYVSLSNAESLPQVIIYGAEEEMRLEQLADQMLQEEILIKKEYESEGKELPVSKQMSDLVASRLAQKGVQLNTLNDQMEQLTDEERTLVNLMTDISTMKEVKEFLKTQKAPVVHDAPRYKGGSRGGGGGGGMSEVCDDCDDDDLAVTDIMKEEKEENDFDTADVKKSIVHSVLAPSAKGAASFTSSSVAPPAPRRAAAPATDVAKKEIKQEMSSISSSQVERVMHRKKKK